MQVPPPPPAPQGCWKVPQYCGSNLSCKSFLSDAFQFVVILEGVLAKISRYDEGTLFSSFLSFTVSFNLASNLLDTVLKGGRQVGPRVLAKLLFSI